MVKFSSRTIATSLSVGERLAARRKELSTSLLHAAAATKISTEYLRALEAGEYQLLPGKLYAKNFLKVYARYLQLAVEPLVADYLTEYTLYTKTKPVANPLDVQKPVERVSARNLAVTPRIIRQATVGLLIVVCLIYLGVKIKGIITAPILVVETPTPDLVTRDGVVTIAGNVEREAELKINGQDVVADEQGKFAETVVLQAGTNIIEVTATKKHSKEARVYRKVVVLNEG